VSVAKELGLSEHDTFGYKRRTTGFDFISHFREAMDCKNVDKGEAGDVLLFREGSFPCHTAILSERYGVPYMIHAHLPAKSVIEEEYSPQWRDKATFCFEFRGLY
jgi:hypothetical protein